MEKGEGNSTEDLKRRLATSEEETKKYRALYRREIDTNKFLKELVKPNSVIPNTGEIKTEKPRETDAHLSSFANDTNKVCRVLVNILYILGTIGSGYSVDLLATSAPNNLILTLLGLSLAIILVVIVFNIYVLGGKNDA